MLPNFLIVGAQKSGTTSLHKYLIQHPQIYLPEDKETKFFVDDSRYVKGISYYESKHFSSCKDELAVGEVDPDYMYFERALERIVANLDLRNLKLIFILRNPTDRAFSHYLMSVRRGIETLSFEEAIQLENARISKDYRSDMHFSYIKRGFYFSQIQRFLMHFDQTNMLFILSEDLKKKPMDVLTSCYRFLNVSENIVPTDIGVQHHAAKVPRSKYLLQVILRESLAKKAFRMFVPSEKLRKIFRNNLIELNQTSNPRETLQEDTRKELAKLYSEHNRKLACFINRDLSHWNSLSPNKE